MSRPEHILWRAAHDLKLEPTSDMLLVTSAPYRWDEYLDCKVPILISHLVGSWEALCQGLWQAGCPKDMALRLVESDGRVVPLAWNQAKLSPTPEMDDWTLALGWSHPEEGWRSRLPLFGRRYIVTRAQASAAALVDRLVALGAGAWSVPTISFTDPDDFQPWIQAVSAIATYDWILFTSPNGVDAFIDRLCTSGLDLRVLGGAKFGCIGPSTAKALNRHHLIADLVPDEYVAEGLLRALLAELGEDISGQRILLPRAQVARTVLPDALRAAGAEVLVAPVYKTVPPDLAALPTDDEDQDPPRLLFTSSSTVDNWIAAASGRAWPCYCIGPITAETARSHGLEVLGVAQEYTIDGLLEMLLASEGLG